MEAEEAVFGKKVEQIKIQLMEKIITPSNPVMKDHVPEALLAIPAAFLEVAASCVAAFGEAGMIKKGVTPEEINQDWVNAFKVALHVAGIARQGFKEKVGEELWKEFLEQRKAKDG